MANEVVAVQKMINGDKTREYFEKVLKDNAASFLSGLSTLVSMNPDLAKTNFGDLTSTATVSYTHLTLPTICSV